MTRRVLSRQMWDFVDTCNAVISKGHLRRRRDLLAIEYDPDAVDESVNAEFRDLIASIRVFGVPHFDARFAYANQRFGALVIDTTSASTDEGIKRLTN